MHDEAGNPYHLAIDNPPDEFDRWLISNPTISPIAILAKALLGDPSKGGTLIDVGANIGSITIPLATAGYQVIAIEPMPNNLRKLRAAIAANPLASLRVAVIDAAASDREGIVHLEHDQAWAQVTELKIGHVAQCMQIDRLCPRFNDRLPLCVKIDVEGHELQALRGARGMMQLLRPLIIFEAIDKPRDNRTAACKTLLTESGYNLFYLRWPVLAPASPTDLQLAYVADFVACPTERSVEFRRLI